MSFCFSVYYLWSLAFQLWALIDHELVDDGRQQVHVQTLHQMVKKKDDEHAQQQVYRKGISDQTVYIVDKDSHNNNVNYTYPSNFF